MNNTPEYLSQLLKDRRQLAAVPNMFFHVERLLDQGNYLHFYLFIHYFFYSEINNVRVNLFNLITRPKIDLPNPVGEKKIYQEKVFIPVQQYPDVSSNKILLFFYFFGISVRTNMHEGLFPY